jgi:hypothetical protein
MSSPSTRRPLADFNVSREVTSTSDFVLTSEYRVGRYGLRVSRDGYGSRGNGGNLLHLVRVAFISEIKADYDWRQACGDNITARDPERRAALVAKAHADHEAKLPWHYCRQPKVGDIVWAHPQCVDTNAVGKGAYEPSIADTNVIDCSNCLVRIFGETVEPRAKVEARAKAERAAAKAKNPPPVCFHCGDARPRTKATEAGEQLPCGRCKEDFETIFWVETTGAYCQYHAETFKSDPDNKQHILKLGIEHENQAYDSLVRREGKYRR